MTHSIPGHVWSVLSKVDVDKFVEKKQNLDYLPWPVAIAEVMNRFELSYTFTDRTFDDGSMEVICHLTIGVPIEEKTGGDVTKTVESFTREMWLPVMDYKMKAIKNPDSRQISDARMRCLVKCIATTTGLGLSLYTKDGLPSAEADKLSELAKQEALIISADQFDLMMEGIAHAGIDAKRFAQACKVETLDKLPADKYDHAMGLINQRIAANAATEQQ